MNGRNERRDQEIGPEEEFALSGSDKTLSYNFCWIKGKRWTMEDSHLAIKLGNIWVFAIFDGHGGKEASEILPDIIQRVLKDKIINFVANSNIPKSMKNCKSNLEKITKATDILTAEQSKSILLEVFEETDKKLYHRLKIYDIKNVGATAALVLVHKNFITTAHCGDSRIHLYENGGQEILHSTKDQKPNDPIEKSRIENNGGTVVINRVMGDLAVARAFGDFQYKKLGGKFESYKPHFTITGDLVICKPEISVFDRTREDSDNNISGIMICCDGVTDVLSDKDILEIYMNTRNEDTGSSGLVRSAFANKSQDNISAGIILLKS